MLKKLALAIGALLVAALLAEGLLSLLAHASLRDAWEGPAAPTVAQRPPPQESPASADEPAQTPDGDTAPAGASPDDVPGLYRVDDDPRVSYSPRPNATLTIYESTARTDAQGLRVLTGPAAQPGSPRVVVLGDSMAFGFGVNDDATLAARLQDALAAARGPDAPPVECRTVAAPSWNHRSAPAFLIDHWDAVQPDIVVYVPCKNDVFDVDGLYESGLRRVTADPGSADPWLTVTVYAMMDVIGKRVVDQAGGVIPPREMGAYAIDSDLSPESSRRYDENAASIVRLRDDLAQRGAQLLLCWFNETDYNWHLSTRLDRLAPDIPSVAFVDHLPPGGTLGFDPHPSPATLEVFGTWLAEDLLARGWIEGGAAQPLPEVPEAYAERRSPWPSAAERAQRAARGRDVGLKLLQSDVDFRDGRGLKQVYGGLNRDTTARSKMLVLLGREGDTLLVELAPLPERPDLYPLRVAVAVDGQPAGEVIVPADGPVRALLDLPDPTGHAPMEVSLVPAAAVLLPKGVHSQLASFQPVRIACRPR